LIKRPLTTGIKSKKEPFVYSTTVFRDLDTIQ